MKSSSNKTVEIKAFATSFFEAKAFGISNSSIRKANKTKTVVSKDLYKKIVFFEWFAVAGLTSWLLMLFVTILH